MASVDGQFAPRDLASYSSAGEKRLLTGSFSRIEVVASDPPSISNIAPAPGTIARAQSVALRVTDTIGLASVVIVADYASGRTATIWDGSSFQPCFTAGSSRTPTTGGADFVLAEDDGWLESFTLRTVAVNTSGIVATTNAALAYTVSNPASAVVPVISATTPTSGSTVAASDAVVVDITHALDALTVVALTADGETVWDGSAFASGYAGSTRVAITHGYRFTIARTSGWAEASLNVAVVAIDARGHVVTSSATFTVTAPSGDHAVPSIANYSPAPGSLLARNTPIEFDVTDDVGLRRVVVAAKYADGSYEVIHDGTTFAPYYLAASARTAITGGFHFSLRRTGGWPSGPSVFVWAVDTSGGEVTS